jgi:hypothetical protein
MTLFVIIKQPGVNSEKLGAAVKAAYPETCYDLGNGVWIVSDATTASEVSVKIGVSPEGINGAAVVIEVASYFGHANPAIWSWMKAKWESSPNG